MAIHNIPKKLYRFRGTQEYHVNALFNDEIWGSRIDKFNDPYECLPCYNRERLVNSLSQEFSLERIQAIEDRLRAGDIPAEFTQLLPGESVQKIVDAIQRTNPNDHHYEQLRMNQLLATNNVLQNIEDIEHSFFNSMKYAQCCRHIACFSEKNDSSLMWGHYADSHRGFCIEYDFSQAIGHCSEKCPDIRGCTNFMLNLPIAPVEYRDERCDATSFLQTVTQSYLCQQIGLSMNLYHQDILIATKCLLTKSKDWSYECEWRLFSPPTPKIGAEGQVITKLKPTAIYLGVNTADDLADKLYAFCNQRSIPCYKMIQNFQNNGFTFSPCLYSDYLKYSIPIRKQMEEVLHDPSKTT